MSSRPRIVFARAQGFKWAWLRLDRINVLGTRSTHRHNKIYHANRIIVVVCDEFTTVLHHTYMQAPPDSHTCFFLSFFLLSFPFVSLEMSLFPSIFCTVAAFSLNQAYVVRCFLPSSVFLPCLVTTGWIFEISLLCENSINQSINRVKNAI